MNIQRFVNNLRFILLQLQDVERNSQLKKKKEKEKKSNIPMILI